MQKLLKEKYFSITKIGGGWAGNKAATSGERGTVSGLVKREETDPEKCEGALVWDSTESRRYKNWLLEQLL